MPTKPPHRPGDGLLDKYFPDADEETREAARDAFRRYALLLVRLGTKIDEDMKREQQEKEWKETHPEESSAE